MESLGMKRWKDRVAVVTGASEGIGEAIARSLAANGMTVAALARRQELLEKLEEDVQREGLTGRVKGYICDVTSESDVSATFRSIAEDFGHISVLVNNAAVLRPINPTDMEITDIENFKLMMDTNVTGVLNCTKAGIESMKLHSVNDGHIINISSVAAHKLPAFPEHSGYYASKHALKVLSASLRNQLKKEKSTIRVSQVSPGIVKTAMVEKYIEKHNIKRESVLLPEDVANAVIYALSAPENVNIADIIMEAVLDS